MATATKRVFRVTIAGEQLLMHNGQLADPLNPWAKQLKAQTSKRKKSDEDHEAIARIEFQGGLYFDDKLGPVLPGEMLDAALMEGAKKNRLGNVFKACVHTAADRYALNYETFGAERTREALWAEPRFRDRRGCGVQAARVIRTRPKFRSWSVTFGVEVLPCELNPSSVEQAIVDAGAYVGIGDFRPRFGLFTVKEFAESKL